MILVTESLSQGAGVTNEGVRDLASEVQSLVISKTQIFNTLQGIIIQSTHTPNSINRRHDIWRRCTWLCIIKSDYLL
ncbi:hypothetical protein OIU76_022149 [Salix suchowensis]|nr:hypothetical protein OIU76_022149 [Salix suchowensis]